MATASRDNPWYVLCTTDKGTKFVSSFATEAEANGERDRLTSGLEERKKMFPKLAITYSVVSKQSGDLTVPDKAVAEVVELHQLDVTASEDGTLLVKVDKEFVAGRVSADDAEKVRSLKTGETTTIGAKLEDVRKIVEGLR